MYINYTSHSQLIGTLDVTTYCARKVQTQIQIKIMLPYGCVQLLLEYEVP